MMTSSIFVTGSAERDRTSAGQAKRLLSPEGFRAWEGKYALQLEEAAEQRDAVLGNMEYSRFAEAQDAVLCALKLLRKRGLSLGEAGAELQHNYGNHCAYSYTDLINVLWGLGWKAGAKRHEQSCWGVARG